MIVTAEARKSKFLAVCETKNIRPLMSARRHPNTEASEDTLRVEAIMEGSRRDNTKKAYENKIKVC
jgi:hypothetical protein